MQFNPEDELLGGPRCRNCHRGASGCGGCHNTTKTGIVAKDSEDAFAAENFNLTPPPGLPQTWRSDITNFFFILMDDPAMGGTGTYPTYQRDDAGNIITPFGAFTKYNMTKTTNGLVNEISYANAGSDVYGKPLQAESDGAAVPVKSSRMADWTDDWRSSAGITAANTQCGDDGISWPHRTLGWKMLKDDLFGIDITGRTDGESTIIGVGETRTYGGFKAHDVDSVCLDCHNPTVWNATTASDHVDDLSNPADDMDDDVFLRGLP